jgi:23S rRNA-/tRNA-specific pseudouridylate synthase
VKGDESHRGKPQAARSEVTLLLAAKDRALVAVKIQGGRRHQIRVHLASVGHAVLGDQLYGDFSALPDSGAWPKRFALHAMALDFVPFGAPAVHIVSEPGDHFWAFAPALRRPIG